MFWVPYILRHGDLYSIACSPNPSFDLSYYLDAGISTQMWTLSYPLPTVYALDLLEATRRTMDRSTSKFKLMWSIYWKLRDYGLPARPTWEEVVADASQSPVALAELASTIGSRLLTDRELVREMAGDGKNLPPGFEFLLQRGILLGEIGVMPGIRLLSGRPSCSRCGSFRIASAPCTHCGYDSCYICEDCANMGVIRGCTPLFYAKRPDDLDIPFAGSLQPDVTLLTLGQQRLISEVEEFLKSQNRICLVEAVCGAGKGLIILELIQGLLNGGYKGQILFTTPRRSVVEEWAERFENRLGGERLSVVYGGRHAYSSHTRVVMATLPQLYRFSSGFDLVIVDEADAFPLGQDPHYWNIINRAGRPDSKMILFTATTEALPSFSGEIVHLKLPVRYHQQALPIPELEVYGTQSQMDKRLVELIEAWLGETEDQVFLFIPTKSLARQVFSLLSQKEYVGKISAIFHAGMEDFAERLEAFRSGELRVAISTTILERGLTVNPCTVVVYWADHPNFRASSLIQMAGRVGRSSDYPDGRVVYLCLGTAGAPSRAIDDIKEKNREAEREGYLR